MKIFYTNQPAKMSRSTTPCQTCTNSALPIVTCSIRLRCRTCWLTCTSWNTPRARCRGSTSSASSRTSSTWKTTSGWSWSGGWTCGRTGPGPSCWTRPQSVRWPFPSSTRWRSKKSTWRMTSSKQRSWSAGLRRVKLTELRKRWNRCKIASEKIWRIWQGWEPEHDLF